MEKDVEELQRFIELHNLRNKFGIIHFYAWVSIKTEQNSIPSTKMEVIINCKGLICAGTVALVGHDLNPNLFPTLFNSADTIMKMRDYINLEITGTHSRIEEIGKYFVNIIPLAKIN